MVLHPNIPSKFCREKKMFSKIYIRENIVIQLINNTSVRCLTSYKDMVIRHLYVKYKIHKNALKFKFQS